MQGSSDSESSIDWGLGAGERRPANSALAPAEAARPALTGPSAPASHETRERPLRPLPILGRRPIKKRPAATAAASGSTSERRPEGEGSSAQLGVYTRVVRALLMVGDGAHDGGKRLMSNTALAESCGVDPTEIRTHLCGAAFACYSYLSANLQNMMERMVSVCRSPAPVRGEAVRFHPQVFVRWRKYDETPLRLRVGMPGGATTAGQPSRSEGQQKLLVTEAGWCCNIKRLTPGGSDILTLAGVQPTVLQALAANKSDHLAEALDKQLLLPSDRTIEQAFGRVVEVSMTDECAAVVRCERLRMPRPTARHCLLHLVCDAHKISAVKKQTFSLQRPFDTNAIRMALSMDGMALNKLRDEMRSVISEQLVVKYGVVPTAEATAHRHAIYDLFIRGSSPSQVFLRSVVESLFNGDIRKEGVVEHIERGCCRSRAHTLDLMVRLAVPCLLPSKFPVIARSNWTGADAAIDAIGLPANIHNLLACSYLRAFPCPVAFVDKEVPAASALCDGPVEDVGDASAENVGDNAPEVLDVAEDPAAIPGVHFFQEDTKHRVMCARSWLSSGKFTDDLLVARIQYTPQSKRMLAQLALTSTKWEHRQRKQYMDTGSREYQLVVAHTGKDDSELLQSAGKLMYCPEEWRVIRQRNEEMQRHIFVLVARLAAAAYRLLVVRHRRWPFKLFKLLSDPLVKEELLDAKDCCLDGYTQSFREYYGEEAGGPAAIAELVSVAAVSHTDTASVERWHSRNQRRAQFRVWTNCQDLETLSAKFLGMQCRDACVVRDDAGRPAKRLRGPRPSAKLGAGPKRRMGKSGPWRAFVHIKAAGRQLSPEFSAQLSEEYRALDAEALEYYRELGVLACYEAQRGRTSGGFGPRLRKRGVVGLPAVCRQTSAASQQVEPLSAPIGPSLPQSAPTGRYGFSRIMSEARLASARAVDDARMDAEETRLVTAEVSEWSMERASDVDGALAAIVAAPPGHGGASSPSPQTLVRLQHPQAFVQQGLSLGTLADEVAAACHRSPAKQRARSWAGLHEAVLAAKEGERGGNLGPLRKQCFEAGMCICQGPGLSLRRFEKRIRVAFSNARKSSQMPWKPLLTKGMLVLRFEHTLLDGGRPVAQGEHIAEDAPLHDDVWVHLSMIYLSPWQPTFMLMERSSAADRGEALGLKTMYNGDRDGAMLMRTIWELIANDLDLDLAITLSFYKLIGGPRQVSQLMPSQQRAVPLDVPAACLWQGHAAEGRRGRGRAPRRRVFGRQLPAIEGPRQGQRVVDVQSDGSAGTMEASGDERPPEDGTGYPDSDDNGPDDSDNEGLEDHEFGPNLDELFAQVEQQTDTESGPPGPAGGPEDMASDSESSGHFGGEDLEAVLDMVGRDGPASVAVANDSAAPPPPPAEAPPRGIVREDVLPKGLAGLTIVLPGHGGTIRTYEKTNTVVMHCPHHPRCRLTRSLKASSLRGREGQGRPLGFLYAWSKLGARSASADIHVHGGLPSLQERQVARQELQGMPLASIPALFDLERPQRPDEPAEPDIVW